MVGGRKGGGVLGDFEERGDFLTEKIISRLGQFGISVSVDERSFIVFETEKVCEFIGTFCNVSEICGELEKVVIERVCGNFLFFLKNSGRLEGFEEEAFVKEILEGDVKVVFDENSVLSPEQRLDRTIERLCSYGRDILISKRCIGW